MPDLSILSNLSTTVAALVIFFWFLRDFLDKLIKSNNELSKTLQRMTDVIVKQSDVINNLEKTINELRSIIEQMYNFSLSKEKKMQFMERRIKQLEAK